MKTLLVTIEFPPMVGGMETFYGKVAEYWPEEIRVIDNGGHQLINSTWLPGLFTVAKELRKSRYDWVMASDILPVGIIVWLLSFLFPFRYTVFVHGLDFTLAMKYPRKRWVTKRILERAAIIIGVNSYTAGQIKALFPATASKISVVNPGAEIEEPVSEASVNGLRENYDLKDKFIITTVGRFVKRKGVDMVLRALPEVIKVIPESRYIIIGQGPAEAYLKSLIAELQLEPYVIMLTGLDRRTKDSWLSLSDIFVMPARDINGDYEGFGIVYLEANLLGTPVIAGHSGGVGDAVIDGLNGLQVDEEDPADIAAAIIKLYHDKELRERLGSQGRERAAGFAWKLQVQKMFAILKGNLPS